MRTVQLVGREIGHRKLNFGLGLVAVAVATGLVVGGFLLLRGQQDRTRELVASHEAIVKQRHRELSDAMRKITKRMGFNVVILPKDQNLDDPFADDFAAKDMPEEYAERLAASNIVTVNHLLPILEKRTEWPERGGRTLFLTGIKGQVPLAHKDPRKPIAAPVPETGIVLGATLAEKEKLAVGDKVTLRGEKLEVVEVHPRRGDKRDLTAWIHLRRMQRLFEKEGRINAIWALECSCAMGDVGRVREELGTILPDIEVREQGEKALARAEARKAASEVAERALREEREREAEVSRLGARFRTVFVPLILIAAGVWLALLQVANVRERRYEIGLLRALGATSAPVLGLFLLRALLCGVVGATLGYFLGWGGARAASAWLSSLEGTQRAEATASNATLAFDPMALGLAVAAATLLSVVATWLPALWASRQDPGIVLRAD